MKKGYIEETRNRLSQVMEKNDFDRILEYEKKEKLEHNCHGHKHAYRVVDSLYKQKIKKIDKNLSELQGILKP